MRRDRGRTRDERARSGRFDLRKSVILIRRGRRLSGEAGKSVILMDESRSRDSLTNGRLLRRNPSSHYYQRGAYFIIERILQLALDRSDRGYATHATRFIAVKRQSSAVSRERMLTDCHRSGDRRRRRRRCLLVNDFDAKGIYQPAHRCRSDARETP